MSEASIDRPNNMHTKPKSSVTLKPITNPLLQKLFKKSLIPAAGQTDLKDPNILSSGNTQQATAPGTLFDQIRSRIS